MFSEIIGNSHIKNAIRHMTAKKRVGNSLLFAGPEGVGKSLFAHELARLLLTENDPEGRHAKKIASGNHPDIRVYRPEGKSGMHSIESMRSFSSEVYRSPYEGARKIFILHDAERMLPTGANALLKTFEEPLETSVIILLTSAPEALLPTILSRCRTLHFHAVPEEEIAAFLKAKRNSGTDEALAAAALSGGSVGRALLHLDRGKDPQRAALLELLARGERLSYPEVVSFTRELADRAEKIKEETEEKVREELCKGVRLKELSAHQKQLFEKEVEGAVAMRLSEEGRGLLQALLGWYRDLNLLYAGGSEERLLHRDFREALKKLAFNGKPLSVSTVHRAVAEAELALSRSTSLFLCLENLFLKLNLV